MNIPKGYKLVPVEPTEEMLQAAYTEMGTPSCCVFDGAAYRAMLAAAPTPPQPTYDKAKEISLCRNEWERLKKRSHFEPIPFPEYWAGWSACTQSRAKAGEDE